MPTRVAAIGVSHWHSLYDLAYLHHLNRMDDVEIVGLQGRRPTGGRPQVEGAWWRHPDLHRLPPNDIGGSGPTLFWVWAATTPMASIAHYLLDNRIPFLMEKPMSFNAKQLRGVMEKAEATSAFAAVPYINRYQPFVRKAKSLVDEGTYGPMTHFYARMNRPTSARYPAWNSGWMLDPKAANGGCLRNLGSHGMDIFVYLTGEGEDVEVTGAHLSWAGLGERVEDYASVLIRSGKGVLGTVEIGNGFPRDGTDGEWKVAFRDAILMIKDDVLKLNTADGEEVLATEAPDDLTTPALRETMSAAGGGEKPPTSVVDCYRAVRLIDLAYMAAGNPYGTAEV